MSHTLTPRSIPPTGHSAGTVRPPSWCICPLSLMAGRPSSPRRRWASPSPPPPLHATPREASAIWKISGSPLQMEDARVKDGGERSTCALAGHAVKPIKGNALLFFNLRPDGAPDRGSFLGGCMVLEGEKWLAAKRIHVKRAATVTAAGGGGGGEGCTDEDDNCSSWAAAGECQRNPVFMLGTPDYFGCCRKSCGSC